MSDASLPPDLSARARTGPVLAVESSCDETAVAILSTDGEVLADQLHSQLKEHAAFGGVVPEVAARAHLAHLPDLVDRALKEAGLNVRDLGSVAATAGPGLIGGLLTGSQYARALALGAGLMFQTINHLEGHALTVRFSHGTAFPYLLLLVSGGHCQLIVVRGTGDYQRIGTTIDDAAGEAFDKVAKLLGLGYPGGPAVEQAALSGDPSRFSLPSPMRYKPNCDFSFSGLKTAVRRQVELLGGKDALSAHDKADLAAAFQQAVCLSVTDRVAKALDRCGPMPLAVAGGVAANQAIGSALRQLADKRGIDFCQAPMKLCTDNAVMIAWAAHERIRADKVLPPEAPRPRWPLDHDAPKSVYAGAVKA